MRDVILIFSIIGGLAAAIAGPLLAAMFAALSLLGPRTGRGPVETTATLALGVTVASIGLGLPLAWAGWQALRGAPGRAYRPLRWGTWLLLFVGVLAIGQVFSSSALAAPLMVLLQIAAGALPALLFLALAVARAGAEGGEITARRALGSIAWGGLGATILGLLGELLLVVIGLVGVAVILNITDPELVARLRALVAQIQQTGRGLASSDLTWLVSSPVVVVAALTLLGILAPALEETLKSLAVPFVAGAGRRLTRLDGFLFGVAAGAGFAIVEGITNGSLALRMPGSWAGLMILRGAAAAMHCLASGLAGLGWQAILTERRWVRGIGFGSLAVILHGGWNLSVGIIGVLSLQATGTPTRASIVIGVLVLVMAALWLIVVASLVQIPRLLAMKEPTPVSDQEPAELSL